MVTAATDIAEWITLYALIFQDLTQTWHKILSQHNCDRYGKHCDAFSQHKCKDDFFISTNSFFLKCLGMTLTKNPFDYIYILIDYIFNLIQLSEIKQQYIVSGQICNKTVLYLFIRYL